MTDGSHRVCGAPHILVERVQELVDGTLTWVRKGRFFTEECPTWCDGEMAVSLDIAVPEEGPFPYRGAGHEVRAYWCSTFTVGTFPMWPEPCGSEGDHLRRPCSYRGSEADVEIREWSDTLLDATIVMPVTPDWGEGRAVVCDTPGSLECIGYDVEPELLTLTVEAYVPLEAVDGEGWVPVGSGPQAARILE